LPDEAEGLQALPEYAVRLANVDVWNAATGDNTLGEVNVVESAAGDADASAAAFTVIP
jgi:hypothetical protein